jgi:hypothetical protein
MQNLQKNYNELLEYIHTRYKPDRPDNPNRKHELDTYELLALDNGCSRLPTELERRFMDILYLIVSDKMQVPVGGQWMKILDFLNAFDIQDSELILDNEVSDTYVFFSIVARMLDFSDLFQQKY